jgi:ArsR family metal-binding transcriptional regulator
MQLSVFRCKEQRTMAYAVFNDEEKLSRTSPTKETTLEKADEAGLVDTVQGKPVLEDNLTIKPCAPDHERKGDEDLDWTPDKA